MQKRWSIALYWKLMITLVFALSVLSCKGNEDLQHLREAAQRGEQSYKQYRTGDYPTAKAALLDYIRYLEGRMADPSDLNSETYKSDIMISYARLAKLEEQNNGSEKETFMQQAVAKCQQLKIKRTCSAEELRAQVDAIDRLPVK